MLWVSDTKIVMAAVYAGVFGLLFGGLLLGVVRSITSEEGLYAGQIATTSGLLISSLASLPDTTNANVLFILPSKDSTWRVFHGGVAARTGQNAETVSFYITRGTTIVQQSTNTAAQFASLQFQKEGNKIGTSSKNKINSLHMDCQLRSPIEKLSIDAGHGFVQGEKPGSVLDSELAQKTRRLGAIIMNSLRKTDVAGTRELSTLTRNTNFELNDPFTAQSTRARIQAVQVRGSHTLISLNIGKEQGIVRAFVLAEGDGVLPSESAGLACLLLNSITNEFDVTSAGIIPVLRESLREDDPRQILIGAPQAVFLEIGREQDSLFDAKNEEKLGAAIARVIEEKSG